MTELHSRSTTDEIIAAMQGLVTKHSPLCSLAPVMMPGSGQPAFQTANGYPIYALRLVPPAAAPAPPPAPAKQAALIIGGVHARELAPPPALVNFADRLLEAYKGTAGFPIDYFERTYLVTNPNTNQQTNRLAIFQSAVCPQKTVKNLLDFFDLYIVPLVNPDGRKFVLQDFVNNAMWRKNRRPKPNPSDHDTMVGVDVGRNFDIAWDPYVYYDDTTSKPEYGNRTAAAAASSSSDPANPEYRGTAANSEQETKALAELISTLAPRFFVDVHSYAGAILFPWGIETGAPTMKHPTTGQRYSFRNAFYNMKRNGRLLGGYVEYLPKAILTRLHDFTKAAATRVKDGAAVSGPSFGGALARTHSTYRYGAANKFYEAASGIPGSAMDYVFSQQFQANGAHLAAPNEETNRSFDIMSFSIECGMETDDGDFAPDPVTQFPKVQRELFFGLLSLMSDVGGVQMTFDVPPPPKAGKIPKKP